MKKPPLEKVIAPPQIVEGEDWVALQLKTSPMKKLFKQKSLTNSLWLTLDPTLEFKVEEF